MGFFIYKLISFRAQTCHLIYSRSLLFHIFTVIIIINLRMFSLKYYSLVCINHITAKYELIGCIIFMYIWSRTMNLIILTPMGNLYLHKIIIYYTSVQGFLRPSFSFLILNCKLDSPTILDWI